MYNLKSFFIFILLAYKLAPVFSQANKPFPQCNPITNTYPGGAILPDTSSREERNKAVCSFYDAWKSRYIRTAKDNQCYVWVNDIDKEISNSEGQGYGMIIVAFMAGYDPAAQKIYDSLYHYFKEHPADSNKYLMAWEQDANFNSIKSNGAADAASDGDMDIAYSLLLADAQWGSNENINHASIDYKKEALAMIAAIKSDEMNAQTFSVLLSNATKKDSKHNEYFSMRLSDFMPAHFRAFYTCTKDSFWLKAIDNNYALVDLLQRKFSPKTGLVPDFVRQLDVEPKPAEPNYKETKYDGAYYNNACRVPWRVATDYILNGNAESKRIAGKINDWLVKAARLQPLNISPGYRLNGTPLATQDELKKFDTMPYLSSFTVSAMVDVQNKGWLNKLWMFMLQYDMDGLTGTGRRKGFNYYDNTIKLFDMIILSGNYWAP